MKVYLDDERQTPVGWVRCYWPDDVIALIKRGGVSEVSLDHDLGDDSRGTGYDVLTWIEEQVYFGLLNPPKINIHSANPTGILRMEMAKKSIERMAAKTNGRE